MMLKEFKPSFVFLAKFLVIYVVGNTLYGIYIESFVQQPDRITAVVASQTSFALNTCGAETYVEQNTVGPTVLLKENGRVMLNIFEGCNGINVMIIFVAFIVAFGGPRKPMLWFLILGLAIIHVSNLFRISLLYYVARFFRDYFYYVHKYFFTGILYLIVFALWTMWVLRFNDKKASKLESA
ncbi:MAG: exosortase family protein XrtF [Bacteroidota bacterium]